MQVISLSDGFFHVDPVFAMAPQTTAAQLKNHFSGGSPESKEFANGHSHYKLRNIEIDGLYFIITVYFEKERLTSISFICRSKPYPEVPSWDNFNADEEDKEAEFLKNWMMEQTGALSGEHAWGKVGVYFDFHNRSTVARLDYI